MIDLTFVGSSGKRFGDCSLTLGLFPTFSGVFTLLFTPVVCCWALMLKMPNDVKAKNAMNLNVFFIMFFSLLIFSAVSIGDDSRLKVKKGLRPALSSGKFG